MKKLSRVTGLALVICAVAAGCASMNPPPSEASLGYTGGPVQGIHYSKLAQPGSGLTWLGWADNHYEYPTTVRTYIVSSEAGEGDKANVDGISAPTKDGVVATYQLAINFKLNVSRLKKFHESIGLARNAFWVNDEASQGWKDMLNDFFRQQIENSLQDVSRTLTADELWRGAETFSKINDSLSAQLKDRINTAVGGNYFCGPTFSGPVAEDDTTVECPNMQVAVKAITLPQNIIDSYAAQKVAENNKITATNNGDAAIVEAQKKKEAADAIQQLYTDPNYLAYLQAQAQRDCANNSNCTLVVTPQGGGVNVNVSPK